MLDEDQSINHNMSSSYSSTEAKVYAISDIHSDHPANDKWLEALPESEYLHDVLIVAGDVSDKMDVLDKTLTTLRSKFGQVLYVPGNHDLWVRRGRKKTHDIASSMDKLNDINLLCDRCDVQTGPVVIPGRCIICPLLSWYSRTSTSTNPPQGYKSSVLKMWMDFINCDWEATTGDVNDTVNARLIQASLVNKRMLEMNSGRLKILESLCARHADLPIITFSHFVPRQDLLPPIERLRFKELIDVSISGNLDQQIRSANSSIHVFGHTHIPCNRTIDGVQYIQQPLGYPTESWISQKEISKMRVWPLVE